jgi:hypothetical protein
MNSLKSPDAIAMATYKDDSPKTSDERKEARQAPVPSCSSIGKGKKAQAPVFLRSKIFLFEG